MPVLPIENVIPELRAALQTRHEVVLEAPPGAGKTTLVPIVLFKSSWLGGQKVIMLEPRRLAARAAAERMASMLNEKVGQTVGYRVRLDTQVSEATRIEIVTEGILTRMLQNDPALTGVGLVIFDEFHERSLDADLGLALVLQARELFRDNEALKILTMSATLDGAEIARLLDDAPVISSEGQRYPVRVQYSEPWHAQQNMVSRVVTTITHAINSEEGSILAFLSGQREIKQVCSELATHYSSREEILITPLYGDLTLEAQRQAIQSAPKGKRKIVLATDIAETSLTIEGVRIVIDSGLHRKPVFDHALGMSRLHTKRISQASSVQRMGRAGRLEAGICYRLWSEAQQKQLVPFNQPQILQADLLPLALQLHQWGVNEPDELSWLDPPPLGPYKKAKELLLKLGALENQSDIWQLTAHGKNMAALPVQPRLAHMLLVGKQHGLTQHACHLAAILSERDLLPQTDVNIQHRLDLLFGITRAKRQQQGLLKRLHKLSKQFEQSLKSLEVNHREAPAESSCTGYLLANAYPDRIAQQRQSAGVEYQLSSGRAARLRDDDVFRQFAWLAVAQVGGRQGESVDQIYLAAELDPDLFSKHLKDLVLKQDVVNWERDGDRLVAEQQIKLGVLTLQREPLQQVKPELRTQAVLSMLVNKKLSPIAWDKDARQWQRRVMMLRNLDMESTKSSEWPDVSDVALIENIETWLGPFVGDISHADQLAKLELKKILTGLLPWPLSQKLDSLAPQKYQVPSGSKLPIDYQEFPPVLAVRVQEMFGCDEHPRIANGRVALKLHLLSPAHRPVQVTQDITSFWKSSYEAVKKEMKGRYPKHPWPDDPLSASATTRVKRKN